MKTQTLLLAGLLFSVSLAAQSVNYSSEGIAFQGLVVGAGKEKAAYKNLLVIASIIQPVYDSILLQEQFNTTTNGEGIFTIILGKGQKIGGYLEFNQIKWTGTNLLLNIKLATMPTVEMGAVWDYRQHLNDMGTTAFHTVPYAYTALNVSEQAVEHKLNTEDTAKMLQNYAAQLKSLEQSKLNIADTTKFLLNYTNRLTSLEQERLRVIDTSTMLQPYLKKIDTALLLAHYNTLMDGLNRQKLNISDTTQMLQPYQNQLNLLKTNITVITDTNAMFQAIQGKLSSADTTLMLQPYLKKTDTAAMLAYYKLAMDSLYKTKLNTWDTLSLSQRINKSSNGFTHYLGENYGGGIVYYLYRDKEGIEKGLIVSLKDQSAGVAFGLNGTNIPNAESSWDGLSNTNAIVATSGNPSTSPASLCDGYSYDGYSDWYLPAIDELVLLYVNRFHANQGLEKISEGVSIEFSVYWSSTENSSTTARSFSFASGTAANASNKTTSYNVRAVRRF